MARRKSDCVKWTLVLVLVLFSSLVCSRPQDTPSSITTDSSIEETDASAENVIRYHEKFNISYQPLSLVSKILNDKNNSTVTFVNSNVSNNLVSSKSLPSINFNNARISRLVDHKRNNRKQYPASSKKKLVSVNTHENKPVIKKIITKWTDNAKYEDLKIPHELKTSFDSDMYPNSDEYSTSTEDDIRPTIQYQYNVPNNNKIGNHHRPKPTYSAETQLYSSNVQVYDNYPHSFTPPSYMFSTPTPTPIITNVGYPKPWPENNFHVNIRPTTRKPMKPTRPKYPHNHNSFHNHSPQAGSNFEVSTIKAQPSYTDRIVIRPEEYNASPYDCPTIFLSLNNTFQGEGKEVCPDLNIAVNTNVINKNNVVDTEEDTDTSLTNIFGLPFGESESEDANTNESTESYENQDQTEDASIEGQSLANYNAASEVSDEVSINPSNIFTAISRPKRPSKKKKDIFGLSSIVNFFQPFLKGFTWLAAINPLSFSAVSFILTPVILLVAGLSAFATVFSPFSYARDASIDPNNPPQWQWDDYYKTWYWSSLLDNRKVKLEETRPNLGKEFKTPICYGWLHGINVWLHGLIEKIKKFSEANVIRKRRRRKRETWAIRVK